MIRSLDRETINPLRAETIFQALGMVGNWNREYLVKVEA